MKIVLRINSGTLQVKQYLFSIIFLIILSLTASTSWCQCPTTVINCVSFSTRSASSVSQGGGGPSWSSLSNASITDGSVATRDLLGNPVGSSSPKTITVSGFGFTLPSYKYVCGTSVSITRNVGLSAGIYVYGIADNTVTVGGSANLSTGAGWPTTTATETYGGAGTNVGTAIATVNNASFGATLSIDMTCIGVGNTITARLDGFSITVFTHDTTIIPCPLPVTLGYFKGQQVENCAQLSWHTLSEVQSDYFLIEKLIGESFIEIGRVDSKSSSEQKGLFYDYTDCDVAEMNYYQLVHVDLDGKREIKGKVTNVSISNGYEDNISVVPNSILGTVCVGSKSAIKEVILFGPDGKVVNSNYLTYFTKQDCLDSKNVQNGIYTVLVRTADGVYNKKIVIQ